MDASVSPLVEVIADGQIRESLQAIRDHLARELQNAEYARDAAPLAKQLVEVIKAIAALPVAGEVSAVDELMRARAARRAAAYQDSPAV